MSTLAQRDYVLVMDKSGSMSTGDTPTGQSRWDYARESSIAIANKISQLDPDGITLIPFNTSFKVYENQTADRVAQTFQENEPMGGTVLAPVLNKVFADYLARKKAGTAKANGEICLVVTDGQPQDESEVARSIVNFTKQLDNGDGEYGLSFIQVGKDQAAAKFLKKLDDDLQAQGAKFDIVDTKTMEELETLGLTAALEAALVD